MRKGLTYAVIVIAPLLMAAKCQGGLIPVSDACGVLNATLYQDGQFMLDDSEIDALREVNVLCINCSPCGRIGRPLFLL